jgi:hypothetical protein
MTAAEGEDVSSPAVMKARPSSTGIAGSAGGFQASNAIAASRSAYQASRSLPLSQANEASEPAMPARITDGCGPTASA